MRIYKDIVGSVEALSRWNNSASGLRPRGDDEVHWTVPGDMGQGYFSIVRLRPGVVMACTDFQFMASLAGSFEYQIRPIAFSYSVAGDFSIRASEEGDPLYSCRSGYEILSCLPLGKVEKLPPSQVPFKCVSIYMAPSAFFQVFPGMENFVPPDLARVANGDEDAVYYQEEQATVNVQMAIHDILTCPYRGPCRRFFLESKCMELMTHTLWRSRQQMLEAETKGIRPADVERVNKAKKYIDANFRSGLRLLDLARHVGLAHTKLNLYFRQLYGTTVFGYLRELRMSEARSLLAKGHVNVTEAAYSVGYSSLSHFAKVFKDHCGQAPGDFMRLSSKRC